ncbi:MAG TPA: hypothetical protein VK779_06950 [Rhizomicrobium sp.]|nr:hypothetical protein [Rhizomicrobium sp.]
MAATKPAKEPAPGSSVEMPYLIAPMNDADGKLLAYAYVSTKIVATSPDNAVEVRNKTPFIQDAFVRDVNAKSFAKTGDPSAVDQDALTTRLLTDAQRVVGGNRIQSIEIIQVQISPLRAAAPQG